MSLFSVVENDKYVILKPEGDFIGGEETDKFRDKLKVLAQQEKNNLIIDLTKVNYLASIALGVLLSANAFFAKNGGKLALCNANDYLTNVFDITKLPLILIIKKSMEEAVKALDE